MKKVAFYTLGCKLNFSETSTIARQFEARGYQRVDFHERPDIYVINTCSVTDNADKKCRKVVAQARKHNPDAYVTVIGCYAQLKPREIADIPGVDAVLGAAEKFRLLDYLDDFARPAQPRVLAQAVEAADTYQTAYSLHDRTRTFLKVQDGCNYNCAFCTIPLARGRSRSDTIAHVVQAAREIAATGVREIVLTGVNTGDFGIRNGRREDRFVDLLRALDEVQAVDRFRISSVEPNLLTDEIIDLVGASSRFVPHFHVPLQSGSDAILTAMRRRYRTDLYADRVARIRAQMPQACIGVDVIVGFPGETEAEFLTTYRFLQELPIQYLHVFPYSERPNTPAATMADAVPPAVRAERSKRLHILSEKKRRAFYESQLGQVRTVLFEQELTAEGQMEGFTENYVRVVARYDPLRVNELVPVRLTGFDAAGRVEVSEVETAPLTHA